MAIPNMPRKAWLEVALMLVALVTALALSLYLWSTGGHIVAIAPLTLFTCVMTLYTAHRRNNRKI
ncbi:hypothetical protein [Silvibacterium sp.]|uniref:hypothetical protein n=1 Tax=Silvibacterium sp. TaxID=1964179 RepID=UPI0039E445FA